MNTKKLCEIVTTRPDLNDIPLSHIFRVAFAVLEEIEKGTCFFDKEEEERMSNGIQTPREEEQRIAP